MLCQLTANREIRVQFGSCQHGGLGRLFGDRTLDLITQGG
jgi:hypothetical protein